MLIQFWKRRKKQCVSIVCSISILFSSIFFLNGCEATFLEEKKSSKEAENERFTSFTEKLFCKEVAASQISLHYTLKEPEAYGIDKADTAYGTIQTDSTQIKTAAENIQQALYAFSYEKLNVKNRITYDLLKQYLRNLREEADYLYYEEPLNTVNGVQTQIPIVLSEYQFYDRTDVEEYLDVLSETRDYFQQIIAFEREKADKGLFLSDEMADQVLEQCNAFLAMGNGNYLYSTFVSRIGELQELSEKEKSDYVILLIHWGKEDSHELEEVMLKTSKEYVDAGADLVVGSHAHLLQGMEFYKDKLIAYNLGDFIFNRETKDTGILNVNILNDGSMTYGFIPCMQKDYKTSILSDNDKLRVLNNMNNYSINAIFNTDGNINRY